MIIFHRSESIFNDMANGIKHEFHNCKYEGPFKDYMRHGVGNVTYSDGSTYRGHW